MLLERAKVTVPEALTRMAFLQAQYSPAIYIGLWSRVAGVERAAVTDLLERRAIIQGTLLRSTIHVVAARRLLAGRARRPGRAAHRPAARGARQTVRRRVPRRRRHAARGARDRARCARRRSTRCSAPGLRGGAGLWVDLVRVPPSGTWDRRRADLYGLAEEWVGPEKGTAADGVDLLVRRYLAGFGPATPKEIANWAGLPVATVTAALDGLDLRRFRTEDGAALVDLPGAPLPDAATPAPVRFLSNWDAALLVHARRTGILPEEHRPKIFHTRAPQSFPTFLVDGAVAGTWKFVDGRVELEEFAPLPRAVRTELAEEGERLAAFHA